MALPDVFAVYRRDTQTFQLLQPHKDEEGKILRLKNWSRPDYLTWRRSPLKEQEALAPWFTGSEWYVVPTQKFGDTVHIHSTKIHDQEYLWWSLHHKLVWSTPTVCEGRASNTAVVWKQSPSILVIELNSKRIHPRVDTGFYPKWVDVKPEGLEQESDRGSMRLLEFATVASLKADEPLRIRTPNPRAETDDLDECYAPRALPYCTPVVCNPPLEATLSHCALGTLFVSGLCILGCYGVILVEALGL